MSEASGHASGIEEADQPDAQVGMPVPQKLCGTGIPTCALRMDGTGIPARASEPMAEDLAVLAAANGLAVAADVPAIRTAQAGGDPAAPSGLESCAASQSRQISC